MFFVYPFLTIECGWKISIFEDETRPDYTHTTFCPLSSMESMRDDYEWTAMIIPMKMAMRMDWISLDVEPT